jgi:hypothetical protein
LYLPVQLVASNSGGTGIVQPHGGYKAITVVQLCNGLAAYDAGRITFRALRIYFATFAAVAVREAANRTKHASRGRPRDGVRFRTEELANLAGLAEGEVRGLLRRLVRSGLLTYSESAITAATHALPDAEALSQLAAGGGRSPRRPVPVPRPLLRLLARSTQPSLVKALVAYLVRGLSIDRRTGELRAKGSVKATWIARVFGLSERAARYARRDLIRSGIITPEGGSSQRKLNRDGAYFVVNLGWGGSPHRDPKEAKPAPRGAESALPFAPPGRDKRTSNELKYQKAPSADATGGCGRGGEGKPTLRSIRPDDLRRFSAVMSLYEQATRAGWLERSEANLRNFVAAAVRATQVRGDSARIFVTIVKRRLWHHITLEQEERAVQAINRVAGKGATARRTRSGGTSEPSPPLSKADVHVKSLLEMLRGSVFGPETPAAPAPRAGCGSNA